MGVCSVFRHRVNPEHLWCRVFLDASVCEALVWCSSRHFRLRQGMGNTMWLQLFSLRGFEEHSSVGRWVSEYGTPN